MAGKSKEEEQATHQDKTNPAPDVLGAGEGWAYSAVFLLPSLAGYDVMWVLCSFASESPLCTGERKKRTTGPANVPPHSLESQQLATWRAYILEGTASECSWSALALKNASSGLSEGGGPSTIDWRKRFGIGSIDKIEVKCGQVKGSIGEKNLEIKKSSEMQSYFVVLVKWQPAHVVRNAL